MKKYIPAIALLFTVAASHADANPSKNEKKKTNTTLWISLGTVFWTSDIIVNNYT